MKSRSVASTALLLASFGCGQAERHHHADANAGGSGGSTTTTSQGGSSKPSGGRGGNGGGSGANNGGSAGTAGIADPAPCGVPSTSQIPRLTNEQYGRTVRDLLGVTTVTAKNKSPSEMLAPEHPGDLTDLDLQVYLAAAEAIAAQVMATPAQRSRFIKCQFVGDGSACLHDTIVEFGRRAFRRPLSDSELERFETIARARADITEHGTPDEVAEVLLETFLVSPSFLQRAEISGVADPSGKVSLSPYEVASRLSYVLWGSTPDEILDQTANAGELVTKEQLLAQGVRMILDPKARELVAAFHRFYLRMGPNSYWSQTITRESALFPAFTPAVAATLTLETERFFDEVAFVQRGSFQDLFLSPVGFVNRDTAPIYGLDPAGFSATLTKVALDPVQRPGFLTRVGFLATFAHEKSTAPTLRGSYILSKILGFPVPAPPPTPATPTPPPDPHMTNRQWVEASTSSAACIPCHQIIDPPGFVLEAYDAIGAWQTVEKGNGLPIDTAADVRLSETETARVQDPAELMQRIATARNAQLNYAERWLAYAYQRQDNPDDACVARQLATRIGQAGYSLLDLMVEITQTDAFRLRVREEP